jgi:hypothetical protein
MGISPAAAQRGFDPTLPTGAEAALICGKPEN